MRAPPRIKVIAPSYFATKHFMTEDIICFSDNSSRKPPMELVCLLHGACLEQIQLLAAGVVLKQVSYIYQIGAKDLTRSH